MTSQCMCDSKIVGNHSSGWESNTASITTAGARLCACWVFGSNFRLWSCDVFVLISLKSSSLMLILSRLKPTGVTLPASLPCLVCQHTEPISTRVNSTSPFRAEKSFFYFFSEEWKQILGKAAERSDLWSYLHDKCAAALGVTNPRGGAQNFRRNKAQQRGAGPSKGQATFQIRRLTPGGGAISHCSGRRCAHRLSRTSFRWCDNIF